jgi:hypothetical protein
LVLRFPAAQLERVVRAVKGRAGHHAMKDARKGPAGAENDAK